MVEIGSTDDCGNQQGMEKHRAKQVPLEGKIARNGESGGHISILLRPCALCQGLGDNTDVVDAGNAQSIDHGSKNAKGHLLVAAQEDALLCIFQLRFDLRSELVDVDRIIAEVD